MYAHKQNLRNNDEASKQKALTSWLGVNTKLGNSKVAFTLVELAIVLVIIGLIVGGVLVGRDLIASAQIRAQISQLQQFQTATNTFRTKYNHLPGDMPLSDAISFGLSSAYRCPTKNGNGVIDGCSNPTAPEGEAFSFWEQLANANLIKGKFLYLQLGPGSVYGSDVGNYLPTSKIGGNSSYVYVWGHGPSVPGGSQAKNGKNYFAVANVASLIWGSNGMVSSVSITPVQAYIIDSKIDDGYPQLGKITAMGSFGDYSGGRFCGAMANSNPGHIAGGPTTAATLGSSTTCYDNNNTSGATQEYSIRQDGGNNITCVISLEFQ